MVAIEAANQTQQAQQVLKPNLLQQCMLDAPLNDVLLSQLPKQRARLLGLCCWCYVTPRS